MCILHNVNTKSAQTDTDPVRTDGNAMGATTSRIEPTGKKSAFLSLHVSLSISTESEFFGQFRGSAKWAALTITAATNENPFGRKKFNSIRCLIKMPQHFFWRCNSLEVRASVAFYLKKSVLFFNLIDGEFYSIREKKLAATTSTIDIWLQLAW